MSAALTTEELAVPGVEVVSKSQGKAFAGPFYSDQVELLREFLRQMPKREAYLVVWFGENESAWIHRKP